MVLSVCTELMNMFLLIDQLWCLQVVANLSLSYYIYTISLNHFLNFS